MNSPLNWQDFLKQAGLPENASCLTCTQQKHSLVRVTGSDAESFLHAQLSNAVTGLKSAEVRFAAWCNAKGRVWTLVRYWKDECRKEDDAIILRMPADQVEATVKRLRMFVMRSDVQLEPLDWQAIQFLGPDADSQANTAKQQAGEESHLLPLPAAWPLYEVWNPILLSSDLPQLPESIVALPRILAGSPEVFAAQREEWIPQMLNLDKLNGIDFKKGCYPGQEIVAKLHYKGGLKQRMFVGTIEASEAAPAPMHEITDTAGKKVGNILETASIGKQCWLSFVTRLEAIHEDLQLDGKPVHICSNQRLPQP